MVFSRGVPKQWKMDPALLVLKQKQKTQQQPNFFVRFLPVDLMLLILTALVLLYGFLKAFLEATLLIEKRWAINQSLNVHNV